MQLTRSSASACHTVDRKMKLLMVIRSIGTPLKSLYFFMRVGRVRGEEDRTRV